MRPSGRAPDMMRPVSLEPGVAKYAEGSCLAKFGDTHVLCAATVEDRVPPFLRNTGKGWVTAEYGMLPRSTLTRTDREAARGVLDGPQCGRYSGSVGGFVRNPGSHSSGQSSSARRQPVGTVTIGMISMPEPIS